MKFLRQHYPFAKWEEKGRAALATSTRAPHMTFSREQIKRRASFHNKGLGGEGRGPADKGGEIVRRLSSLEISKRTGIAGKRVRRNMGRF